MSEAHYAVGIDLGTTHCALSYVDLERSEGEENVQDLMPVPAIFPVLQRWGDIEDEEMWQTFNMGIGFVIAVAPADVEPALEALRGHHKAKVIGHVEEGKGVSVEPLEIEYGGY